MRITQEPLDEDNLWEYLNSGDYQNAESLIDWYFSTSNPSGFDDPEGIHKPVDLTHEFIIDSSKTLNIYKSKKSHLTFFIIVSLVFLGFGILSIKAGNWIPLLIPSIILPAVIGIVIDFFDNKWQIRITPDEIEFRKSKLAPIKLANILVIYHYHRNNPGLLSSDFMLVYKKDSIHREEFSIKGLKLSPEEIVGVTYAYRCINEN